MAVGNPVEVISAALIDTSAELRALVSDESGTGALQFGSGALGTPLSGVLTNCTGLPIATGVANLGTNVATFLTTPSSANLAAALTDEQGSGEVLFSIAAVEANTAGSGAPNVLVAGESSAVLTNEGVSAKNYHTLPAAAAGLQFTFYCHDTDGIRIVAAGDDTIRLAASVSIAAGYVESTTIGSAITLVAINATQWVATSIVLTWVVETS